MLNLLLIFPAWVIAYFVAPYATIENVRITYYHDVVANDVRQIRLWALNQSAVDPNLNYSDFEIAELWNAMDGNLDTWGNAYRLIELNETGPFDSRSSFHVYSLGADGESMSNGNDADDINSWNYDRNRHYARIIAADDIRQYLWRTVWLTPIIYVAIWFVVRAFKESHRIAG